MTGPEAARAALAPWANYYVITGSAATALTGLQLVVQTLIAQRDVPAPTGSASEHTAAAFGTPTVVHFAAALLLSAGLSAPWPSLASVRVVLLAAGLSGAGYVGVVLRRARRQTRYRPVLEDWVRHVALPAALYAVAAMALLLLCVGIHNAWDTVAHLTRVPRRAPGRRGGDRRTATPTHRVVDTLSIRSLTMRLRFLAPVGALVGALALAAPAATRPLGAQLVQQPALTLEAARRALTAADAEARRNGWRVSVAVVDAHGELVAFERMDDAAFTSVPIAQGKARTAARFRRPTRALDSTLAAGRTALLALEGVLPIEGGVPITVGGRVVGAVGVSGATSPQDAQCAQAGASAVTP